MKRKHSQLIVAGLILALAGCTRPAPAPGDSVRAPRAADQNVAPPPQPAVRAEAPALYPAFVLENGKKRWGYLDGSGRFAIPPTYDEAGEFIPGGTAAVTRDGKSGLIGPDGKVVVELAYGTVSPPSPGGIRLLSAGDRRLIVDAAGLALRSVAASGEGLFPFQRSSGNRALWGYVGPTGVVIEPQYESAGPFRDGRALVQVSTYHFALIDTKGTRVAEYPYYVDGPSDELLTYREPNGRHGYLTLAGEVAIPARFGSAQPFEGGLAAVNAGKDWFDRQVGVINKTGQFVAAPEYTVIEPVGAGLFAAGKGGKYPPPDQFIPKALMDAHGKLLTDFLYFAIGRLDQGLICVTDMTGTYFLDHSGKPAKGLPKVSGEGRLRVMGDLIRADIDGRLSYLTRDGKPVWEEDRTTVLADGLRVRELKFRPDAGTLIFYPELSGLKAEQVQGGINAELRKLFVGDTKGTEKFEGTLAYTLDVGFTARRLGNLLQIHKTGYWYGMGAAHGMPSRTYHHFDLTTGARYQLPDLFKKGSAYPDRLTALVRRQIAQKKEGGVATEAKVESNHLFAITTDGLMIYYPPYAIASYAQGFQEFTIPYSEIQDLIDTQGPFWNSFTR